MLPRVFKGKRVAIGDIRELGEADLEKLRAPREKTNVVQKLRESHHLIARMLATGMRPQDVAEQCGFSVQRIYTLRQSPAFCELVEQYRGAEDQAYFRSRDLYNDLLRANSLAAERHLSDKIAQLEEDGELLGIREALAISRDAADRLGYGKKTTVKVDHDFAAMLEKAIHRSNTAKVIEGKVVAIHPQGVATPTASTPSPQTVKRSL